MAYVGCSAPRAHCSVPRLPATSLQTICSHSPYIHQLHLYRILQPKRGWKYVRIPASFIISPGVAERRSRSKNITIRGRVVPLALVCFCDSTLFSDIELRTQARRKIRVAKQYHIQFSVGDTLRLTKKAKEKNNCISWDDIFYLWVHANCPTLSN